MARDEKPESLGVDIPGLQQIMELMEKHDVTELKWQHQSAKYLLRRGPEFVAAPSVPMAAPPMTPTAAPATSQPASTNSGGADAPQADEGLIEITSPTVGTFYQSPAPGEAAFVKIGDRVNSESIVCIVEAMKVFNQIPADVSGTIAKTLMKDGDSVEFGQPLFLVKPN